MAGERAPLGRSAWHGRLPTDFSDLHAGEAVWALWLGNRESECLHQQESLLGEKAWLGSAQGSALLTMIATRGYVRDPFARDAWMPDQVGHHLSLARTDHVVFGDDSTVALLSLA